ncbi:hypothetical protein SAMD00019534_126390 [Acytostelium subglobosum LB1]|uniref:hypothetical protein n=1 Tax=Acytostelium subglobosum LB1 TaxID=1410327 RepID=UPI0006451829|nr:hypothetical protein SAMD00019534_126390 [Acytostelium subglobosum LB1]GAM29463.1 hypothetical protein SAMD00019534_126390 [Acytostelium subglobosum LB1]|eukprot:XP_012747590.1 hypothetical protein SAMD00019534_126390 [Acytostelium subglobosum LB1]
MTWQEYYQHQPEQYYEHDDHLLSMLAPPALWHYTNLSNDNKLDPISHSLNPMLPQHVDVQCNLPFTTTSTATTISTTTSTSSHHPINLDSDEDDTPHVVTHGHKYNVGDCIEAKYIGDINRYIHSFWPATITELIVDANGNLLYNVQFNNKDESNDGTKVRSSILCAEQDIIHRDDYSKDCLYLDKDNLPGLDQLLFVMLHTKTIAFHKESKKKAPHGLFWYRARRLNPSNMDNPNVNKHLGLHLELVDFDPPTHALLAFKNIEVGRLYTFNQPVDLTKSVITNKKQLLDRFKATGGLNTVLLTYLVESTIKVMDLQHLVQTRDVRAEGHYNQRSSRRTVNKLINSKFGIITVSINHHHSVLFTIIANKHAYLLHLDSLNFISHLDYAHRLYADFKVAVNEMYPDCVLVPIKTLQKKVQRCNWRCGLYVYKFVRSFLYLITTTDNIGEDQLSQYLQSMTCLKCSDLEDFDNVEQTIQMYISSLRSTL